MPERSGAFAVPPEVASVASVARSVPIAKVVYWLLGTIAVLLVAGGGYVLKTQNKDIIHAVQMSADSIQTVSKKLDRALGKIEKIDTRVREVERWSDRMQEWRKSQDDWRAMFEAERKKGL